MIISEGLTMALLDVNYKSVKTMIKAHLKTGKFAKRLYQQNGKTKERIWCFLKVFI